MKPELKKAIQESGNNLHLEIAEFLEKSNWEVDLSSYYCDDTTDKPREIDIIAKKEISVFEGKCPEDYRFWVYLFIECKCFKNEIAFRICQNDLESSQSAIISKGFNFNMKEIFNKTNHHYLRVDKIAKLYDTYKDKEGEKSEREKTEEKVFQAITQPVKSLLFFRDNREDKNGISEKRILYYPMVIYRSIPGGITGFYHIEQAKTTNEYLDKLKPTKNLIFGLKYSYPRKILGLAGTSFKIENFCVDFIHQKEFGEYLEMIEKQEVSSVKNHLLEFFNEQRRNDL